MTDIDRLTPPLALRPIPRAEFLRWLDYRQACNEALEWLVQKAPGLPPEEVYATCERHDWIKWLIKCAELPARQDVNANNYHDEPLRLLLSAWHADNDMYRTIENEVAKLRAKDPESPATQEAVDALYRDENKRICDAIRAAVPWSALHPLILAQLEWLHTRTEPEWWNAWQWGGPANCGCDVCADQRENARRIELEHEAKGASE